jgi:hypothetical protein
MRIYLSLVLAILIFSCDSQKKQTNVVWCKESDNTVSIKNMSFRELFKSKGKNGELITITGKFSYSFEDISLSPDYESDYLGIWLIFNNELSGNDSLLKKLNNKRITITGKLDLVHRGHLNSYFCSMYDISCIKQ